jgi:hypothetical protein
MKKNLVYLVVVLALGIGAWFTWQKNNRRSTLDKLDLNFAVPDTASITKVVISQEKNQVHTLERKEGYWMLNNKFKVAPILMDVLLSTIRNVEMMRPLAANEQQTVLRDMQSRYRKVDIYVNGEVYKSYTLGDDAPGNHGTYMMLEGGSPYVCQIRGFKGFLTPRYNVSEQDWRDRLLFSSSPQTIQSVEVKYRRSPVDNYKVGFSGKHFFLEGATRFDTLATAELLLKFKQVYIERFITDFTQSEKDSLLKVGHEWSLELVDIDKAKSHLLNLYMTNDADRSLAYLPKTNEWVTIQNRNLTPVMMRRSQLLGAGR